MNLPIHADTFDHSGYMAWMHQTDPDFMLPAVNTRYIPVLDEVSRSIESCIDCVIFKSHCSPMR